MRKVIVFLVMGLFVVLIAMALTKPNNSEHYVLVKAMVRDEVSHQLANNKLMKEYGEIISYEALGRANSYVDNRLEVHDFVFFTLGTVRHQGMSAPITLGVFKKVIFIGDEEEIKKAIAKKMQIKP